MSASPGVLLALFMIAAPLLGQAPGQTSSPAPQAPAMQTLSDAKLREMLEGLGLAPRKLTKGYLVAIQREGWTYNLQLVLSSDFTKLGMNANLATSSNPSALPASVWRTLLEDNVDVDPSCFYFNRKLNRLYLHRALDNRDITPDFLRQQIDKFCQNIKDTAADWGGIK